MEDDGALGGRVEDLMRALDRQAVRDSTEDDASSHGDDDAGEEDGNDEQQEVAGRERRYFQHDTWRAARWCRLHRTRHDGLPSVQCSPIFGALHSRC